MKIGQLNRVRPHMFRSTLVAGVIFSFAPAQAEKIDRETLLAQAPSVCVEQAQAHYKVGADSVSVRNNARIKYKASLKGVAVPLKVTLNGRKQDRTCVAGRDGDVTFFSSKI